MKAEQQYSEHDKLKKVQPQSQAIGQFLEWLLDAKQYVICALDEKGYSWYPVRDSIEDLLYAYFEIDPKKIEQEKRAMLEEIREANARHTALIKAIDEDLDAIEENRQTLIKAINEDLDAIEESQGKTEASLTEALED